MNLTSFSASRRNSGDLESTILNINFPTLQAYTIELAVRSPTVRKQDGKILIQANSDENKEERDEKITTQYPKSPSPELVPENSLDVAVQL